MQLSATPGRRLSDERGFTMITVMLSLFILGLLTVAAIAAAQGDIHLSRHDQDDKQAYAAAEAGVNDYLAHLSTDPDYWTRCAGENSARPLASGNAVNERFTGAAPAGRKWRAVPGSNSRYSIELLPRPPRGSETSSTSPQSCSTSDPSGSMIDADGNFRIRVTGEQGEIAPTGDDPTKGIKKSVVATFRRTSFLDYVYFTDYENLDPAFLSFTLGSTVTRATDSSDRPTGGQDLQTWAADKCDRHWWGTQAKGDGRSEMPTWHGQFQYGGNWTPSGGIDETTSDDPYFHRGVCGEITFADQDEVQGPFHSNDTILTSGTPGFGRPGRNDRVEAPGYRGGTPTFRTGSGQLNTSAAPLTLPPSNTAVKAAADAAYIYTGPTTITLNGSTMTVMTGGSTRYNVPWPANGVVYVDNAGTCPYGYQPTDPTNVDPNCGQVRVSGTYSKDLTIASADDVVIMGNTTRVTNADAVLGLIADKFVRVWHPSCSGTGSATTNLKVDAAILAVNHSFVTDNYNCGDPLGTLNVTGAIAQKHRGTVGVGGSSISSGYVKNYAYDDRLQYRSPPYFLDPVQASWRIVRQNEQSGAR